MYSRIEFELTLKTPTYAFFRYVKLPQRRQSVLFYLRSACARGYLFLALVFFNLNSIDASAKAPLPQNRIESIRVERSDANPLIDFSSSPTLGENINGPSVIRVPSWIKNPLGKYYMYFAHHQGKYIRLAYAEALEGPWEIYEPGTLHLDQAKSFKHHIASPDIFIDHEKQELRMYFHGPVPQHKNQATGIAYSKDGIHFTPSKVQLGDAYFRVFKWEDAFYAVAKDANTGWGALLRSEDGKSPFEKRPEFIKLIRHCALLLIDDTLIVFYSRKGDAPERILASTVHLAGDWPSWKESEPIEVIRPEEVWEGSLHPNIPSEYSSAIHVNQLRDPGIFVEDGRIYLFYSYAGEMGIAMAELFIEMQQP